MAGSTWKGFERRMASLFSTTRIPAAGVMGHAQRDAADFRTGLVSFQAKKGYNPPGYLREWLDGIVKTAKGEARFGAVVWQAKGGRDADAFVVMRAVDFAAILVTLEGTYAPREEPTSPA